MVVQKGRRRHESAHEGPEETTEAALQKLDEKGFKEIFSEAVDAGIKRAKELSMN